MGNFKLKVKQDEVSSSDPPSNVRPPGGCQS